MTKNIIYNQLTDENCMIQNDKGEMVPNYDITLINFDEGDILKGKVVKIDKDEVLVDVGFKSEGVIPASELSIRNSVKPDEFLKLDDVIEIMVLQKEDQDGRLILSKKRAEIEKSFDRIEKIYQNDEIVEGQVIEFVKGGLILDIGLRGFLPASLIDIKKTKDLSSYIGEKYTCKIIEVDRNRNNVVLSRKAIIEDERKEQRKEILENIEIGQVRDGIITSIADFGAFVDVDGIDGLIHISELSWNHVKHPSEVVKVGQEVNVEILDIDFEKQRLSLGLKQTQKDPWVDKIKSYKIGDIVQGKVTRIVKFGLFVQIQEDMEGLVHISELSAEPVKRPSDVAKIGDEIIVKIIDIDFEKRRMAFSIRQVISPDAPAKNTEEKEDKNDSVVSESEKKHAEKDKVKEEAVSVDDSEEIEDKNPEHERERAIKEILKQMKDEANLD
ncbi:MAG TPA: 30S ribosomal protein S1 [Actinobacteria bacterium]|nr:30S ribosomal protein S1 [Actinomycetota bacterium]